MLAQKFPQIKTIASNYFAGECAYTQEFEVADDGIVEQPRIISGAILDDYMQMAAVSELNMHFVNSHFMHPDDLLDEDRGAKLGWCKIVFLTGYDDFSYIHSAFQVNAVDYLLKPFTIEEVEACLKKVRSELEKSEIADWSRKTAAKQLMEMALREKQETELLRKNFRGVFGEELEECRFGIIAVYGKTEENICSQIQEKYKGIRYISKTERISILLLAGYLSVKDTAFQIWNDLKEDAPRAVGWCSGAWTADCLYEKAEKLRNCCVLAFHMDPPELFCADEKETEEEKAYHFRDRRSGEKKSVVWSATGKSRKPADHKKIFLLSAPSVPEMICFFLFRFFFICTEKFRWIHMKCQNTTVPKFFRLFVQAVSCPCSTAPSNGSRCVFFQIIPDLKCRIFHRQIPRQQQNADPFRFADVTDALVFFLNLATDVFFRFSINRYDSKPALFQFFSKYTTEIFP